jgi:hypothetical protein
VRVTPERHRCTAARSEEPNDSEVAVHHPAAGRAHPLYGAVAFEGLHAVAEQQLNAVLRVHVTVEAADLRTEDPLVRELERTMTLTSSPRWRAQAANSLPIQPAPTATTRPPPSRRSRNTSQSASVRK